MIVIVHPDGTEYVFKIVASVNQAESECAVLNCVAGNSRFRFYVK